MPELPEVETIVRELRKLVLDRSLAEVSLFREDMLKNSEFRANNFKAFFHHRSFKSIERHGQSMLFHLDNGNKLIAHLGMTGKFVVNQGDSPQDKHLCSQFIFADGGSMDHIDVRRFGRLELHTEDERIPILGRLGVDPLSDEFIADSLKPIAFGKDGKTPRKRAIHTLLMDQTLIAGIGNIYSSEALFRSGIRPTRPAGKLRKKELQPLTDTIRAVLLDSIELGGTTVSDYRRVDDKPGNFKNMLQVYGRAGEPCRNCNSQIKKITINARSAFFCPKCQR